METGQGKGFESALSALPSVDSLLKTRTGEAAVQKFGARSAASLARGSVDALRKQVTGEGLTGSKEDLAALAESVFAAAVRGEERSGVHAVINATGVIIHTNLGRAPLSDSAVEAIREASGYCNLEYDLVSGKRGRRGERAEWMLAELTGAEDALVVNNCAAAAVLVLSSLCAGGEAVISRGELVEIGGDFRVPDVMKRSGAQLAEVGTTNRTRLSDYERAINDNTRMILKVHPSNYRIIGFTSIPSVRELAELAHSRGLLFYEDAGSGALVDLSRFGLGDEPLISESIAAGADVVTFSGDKLMGSVQAGLLVGRAEVIGRIRAHPLYRAFRPGKMVYAALEATLSAFERGTEFEEIPVLKMLAATREEIDSRTASVMAELQERLGGIGGVAVEKISAESVIGGGSAPGAHAATAAVSIRHQKLSSNEIEARLRNCDPPVAARIYEDAVLLDLRTVAEDQIETLKNAVCSVFP